MIDGDCSMPLCFPFARDTSTLHDYLFTRRPHFSGPETQLAFSVQSSHISCSHRIKTVNHQLKVATIVCHSNFVEPIVTVVLETLLGVRATQSAFGAQKQMAVEFTSLSLPFTHALVGKPPSIAFTRLETLGPPPSPEASLKEAPHKMSFTGDLCSSFVQSTQARGLSRPQFKTTSPTTFNMSLKSPSAHTAFNTLPIEVRRSVCTYTMSIY